MHIKRDVCGWLVPRVKSLLVDAGVSVLKKGTESRFRTGGTGTG